MTTIKIINTLKGTLMIIYLIDAIFSSLFFTVHTLALSVKFNDIFVFVYIIV